MGRCHRALCGAGIVLLFWAAHSLEAWGQTKSPGVRAEPADYALLQDVKRLTGTIVVYDRDRRTMSLRVDIPRYEPNPNYRPPDNQAAVRGQIETQRRQAEQLQRESWQHQQSMARLRAQ